MMTRQCMAEGAFGYVLKVFRKALEGGVDRLTRLGIPPVAETGRAT
jgi:hypothetical protein